MLLLGFLLFLSGGPETGLEKHRIISYVELGEIVRQQRGKVVVVDLWATW